MFKPLKIGDVSNKGLIVKIKGAVTQVQTSDRVVWMKTENLSRAVSECR